VSGLIGLSMPTISILAAPFTSLASVPPTFLNTAVSVQKAISRDGRVSISILSLLKG
jgi:hypothetical protein